MLATSTRNRCLGCSEHHSGARCLPRTCQTMPRQFLAAPGYSRGRCGALWPTPTPGSHTHWHLRCSAAQHHPWRPHSCWQLAGHVSRSFWQFLAAPGSYLAAPGSFEKPTTTLGNHTNSLTARLWNPPPPLATTDGLRCFGTPPPPLTTTLTHQ